MILGKKLKARLKELMVINIIVREKLEDALEEVAQQMILEIIILLQDVLLVNLQQNLKNQKICFLLSKSHNNNEKSSLSSSI